MWQNDSCKKRWNCFLMDKSYLKSKAELQKLREQSPEDRALSNVGKIRTTLNNIGDNSLQNMSALSGSFYVKKREDKPGFNFCVWTLSQIEVGEQIFIPFSKPTAAGNRRTPVLHRVGGLQRAPWADPCLPASCVVGCKALCLPLHLVCVQRHHCSVPCLMHSLLLSPWEGRKRAACPGRGSVGFSLFPWHSTSPLLCAQPLRMREAGCWAQVAAISWEGGAEEQQLCKGYYSIWGAALLEIQNCHGRGSYFYVSLLRPSLLWSCLGSLDTKEKEKECHSLKRGIWTLFSLKHKPRAAISIVS